MERRNWLWKKKASDKVAAAPEALDGAADENVSSKVVTDYLTIPEGLQLEETVKLLSEKLAAAQSEILEKDAIAKQHMKVAEEAVTGWEKSESEAATLKRQAEEAIQIKTAVEDRALHLDSALKECVRQLRLVREEQEERLHETISRKSREWESCRLELEREVSELRSQQASSESQVNSLVKSLQERKAAVLELSDAKLRAENESRNAMNRVEAVEKEYAKLKYDLQVMQRELEIRNDEKEYGQKLVEAANRQQIESVKKAGKLEAECQRLRMLLKKKLPGPGALARMRVEAETRNPRQNFSDFADHSDDKENEFLLDRLRAMEDETRMLKEVLAKKSEELQESKVMCARTASKLSYVEEQLGSSGSSRILSHATPGRGDKFSESAKFKLMDDFIEMERLAADDKENSNSNSNSSAVVLEAALKVKEEEARHANQICGELRDKLAAAEKKLHVSHCSELSLDIVASGANNRHEGKDSESKARLRSAVGRIIHLVESMAQEYSSSDSSPDSEAMRGPDGGVKRLVAVSKNLLQDKVSILDFIAELSCVLDFVVGLTLNSGSLGRMDSPKSSEDSQRSATEISQLKSDIAALESNLRASTEALKSTRIQLATIEEERCLVQQQLSLVKEEKRAVQSELVTVNIIKGKLELRVNAADGELSQLRQTISALRSELQEEQRRHQEALQKLHLLQQQNFRHSENITAQKPKEQELVAAAEKLADCQRTIHALGKQLETLGLPTSSTNTPARHFSRVSELPNPPDFNSVHKQETYWSSDSHAMGNSDTLFYHSGPHISAAAQGEVPEIPLEVRTPARYYRKSKAAAKLSQSSHGNGELSKSLNAADLTTTTHCSDKQHGVGVVLGLGKFFSRSKG